MADEGQLRRPCLVIKQVLTDGELTGFEVTVFLSMDVTAVSLKKVVQLGDNPGEIAWRAEG